MQASILCMTLADPVSVVHTPAWGTQAHGGEGGFVQPEGTLREIKSTVKLDFKNRKDKNQLGFKNQITNDQLDHITFKNCQNKNNLTLRTKIAVTKNVLKFECNLYCKWLMM